MTQRVSDARAHVDTFARDHLPPPDAAAGLPVRPARAAVPAAAQLRGRAARRRDRARLGRPALHRSAPRPALDLRRAAAPGRRASPTCSSTRWALRAGPARAAARAQQPDAGGVLVRRDEGRRASPWRRCRCCAPRSCGRSSRRRRSRMRCATLRAGRGAAAGAAALPDARRRCVLFNDAVAPTASRPRWRATCRAVRRPSTPPPTTPACSPSRRAPPASPRRRCTSTAT